MKTKALFVTACLLQAASLFAAAPRIGFVRSLPATYDLAPAERLALIYAIGDTDRVNDFVGDFTDEVARSGAYTTQNAAEGNHHLALDDAAALQLLRREHPADASLGVTAFTCRPTDRSAEGSE